MKFSFNSIRWRVQAWHGFVLLVMIAAFCLTTHRLAWNNQFRRIDRNLEQTERTLIRTLFETARKAPPRDGARDGKRQPFSPGDLAEWLRTSGFTLPPEIEILFRGNEPGFAYFSLRDASGRVLLESANLPADFQFPTSASDLTDELRVINHRREMIRSSPEGMTSVVGLDLQPERDEMRRFAWSLSAVGFGIWVLGLVGGWWFTGRTIQPIADISRTATRIADGNLAERIRADGSGSELDQLSRVLNTTFDRLSTALERQRQFTADASHELKTPVTILLAETQRALKRERSPDEYRAVLATCRTAAERMRRLTESLLLLAKQEINGIDHPRERCDLSALTADTVEHLRPLAAERQLTLITELESVACLGDAAALTILISNLVSNALQHHDRPGGTITIRTTSEKNRVLLTVTDDGPGIPAAHLPHIFDRFYRVDQARTGGSGHSGLGLAIAKTIAENHAGILTAETLVPRGARFNLSLPATA